MNISSGDEGKYRGQVMYDTAKAAVDRMAFGMAEELKAVWHRGAGALSRSDADGARGAVRVSLTNL